MVKKRLIPKLLIKSKKIGYIDRSILVTTHQFTGIKEIGDPVSQAKIYEAQLADELIVLNIDRTPISSDKSLQSIIQRLASETFMPLCIGGGVQTIEDFKILMDLGADKVSINTAAFTNPELISEAADKFGSQCVIVGIDFKFMSDFKKPIVHVDAGKICTKVDVFEWARKSVDLGAGELLLTDMDLDGTGKGLNCAVASEVVERVSVPVILSGGCGQAEHFCKGFIDGKVEGVAAGTFFSFRDQNPIQTRSHLKNAGILIRMET